MYVQELQLRVLGNVRPDDDYIENFARFVLFRLIKKRSFSLLFVFFYLKTQR